MEITTLDQDITGAALPPPDLIKIDIEGWELEAFEGARETLAARHPALFLEMHGERSAKSGARLARCYFSSAAGYDNILHVELGTWITAGSEAIAAEGHLYCRYTQSRSTA